jgi:hypothetical protein
MAARVVHRRTRETLTEEEGEPAAAELEDAGGGLPVCRGSTVQGMLGARVQSLHHVRLRGSPRGPDQEAARVRQTRADETRGVIVDVARLLDALGRMLWKHGMVRPELLKHTVHEDGSHTISLTLSKDDVKWTPPKTIGGWRGAGPTTPPNKEP